MDFKLWKDFNELSVEQRRIVVKELTTKWMGWVRIPSYSDAGNIQRRYIVTLEAYICGDTVDWS